MKYTATVLAIMGIICIGLPLDVANAAGYQPPCPAPLPGLGLTLLGQFGAGAAGWRFLRRKRKKQA